MPAAVTDAPAIRIATERAADAAAARAGVERLAEAQPETVDELEAGGILLDAVVALAPASHSLFAALVQDPAATALLRDRVALTAVATDADYASLLADVPAADDPAAELRRRKRRALVRIAARDLLGMADLATTGRELAAIAQACLAAALDIAAPVAPMAVIGMGKLGGRELNYSSDVDLMFVHEGASRDAERAARALLHTMSDQTADGIVFRSDAGHRPE
jgi:glutamate-ammonia-ligase adenylyltransferase